MVGYRQLQLICIMYIVAWMIAPPLAYDTVFRLIAVATAGIWILIQNASSKFRCDTTVSKYLQTYLLCAAIYVISLFLFRLIFGRLLPWGALYADITTYVLLFVGYVGGVYCREMRYEDLKKLFYFTLIIAVLFSITTALRSVAYEGLTRNAGGEADPAYTALAREAAMHGVGAFGFFCFTSVFAPLILWCSYSVKGRKKILLLLAFTVVEIGLISAGYTLALLISLVGIAICLFNKVRSPLAKLIIFLVFILMIMTWNAFSAWLYAALASISAGSMYENKVEDIFSFLLNGESTGSFESRQERYLYSLQSIFKYPVIGSYFLIGIRAVGYHSSILDTFAAYGWIVGGAWMYLITVFPVKLARNKNEKGLKILAFVLLFATALFNTHTMMMGVFYFLIPAVSNFAEYSKINNKEK